MLLLTLSTCIYTGYKNSIYSDWLRVGWAGDRIPAGVRFSVPSRPVPRSTQPPVKGVPSLTREYSGRGVALTTHPHLAPGYDWIGAIPQPPFCDCVGMSWSDLYCTYIYVYMYIYIYIYTHIYAVYVSVSSYCSKTNIILKSMFLCASPNYSQRTKIIHTVYLRTGVSSHNPQIIEIIYIQITSKAWLCSISESECRQSALNSTQTAVLQTALIFNLRALCSNRDSKET